MSDERESMRRPLGDGRETVLRLEEDARVHVAERPGGLVRVKKRVESDEVDQALPRMREEVNYERETAHEDDSGEIETLPDGSISIPVLEEELVVTRRLVVRERIIVRKQQVTEEQQINVDLRRERVEIEED